MGTLAQPHYFTEGEIWVNKSNLTPPLFIEVPVPRKESDRSCICFRGVDFGSSYDYSNGFRNCSDSDIRFVFNIIVIMCISIWLKNKM